MKTCTKCGAEKSKIDFYRESRRPDGYSNICKVCTSIKEKQYYYKDGHKTTSRRLSQKNTFLKKTYGITLEDVINLHTSQKGLCAICGKPILISGNALTRGDIGCVDHNHDTGKVRGLLCHTCNRALGLFQDSKLILLSALSYLEKTND